jgi:hypothetical protein
VQSHASCCGPVSPLHLVLAQCAVAGARHVTENTIEFQKVLWGFSKYECYAMLSWVGTCTLKTRKTFEKKVPFA